MNSQAFPWIALGFGAALLASPVFSQTPAAQTPAVQTIDRQAALDALVAAEKAFSRTVAEKGIRDSFLDFMADDGVLFRPDPVNAKESLRARPAIARPAVVVSGLRGGLSRRRSGLRHRSSRVPGKGGRQAGSKPFATVWKRQADGSWKAAVDLGTPGNPPMPVAISLRGPGPGGGERPPEGRYRHPRGFRSRRRTGPSLSAWARSGERGGLHRRCWRTTSGCSVAGRR